MDCLDQASDLFTVSLVPTSKFDQRAVIESRSMTLAKENPESGASNLLARVVPTEDFDGSHDALSEGVSWGISESKGACDFRLVRIQRGGRDSNARMDARSGTETARFDTDGEGAIGVDRAPPYPSVPGGGRLGTNGGGEGREGEVDSDGRFELGDVVEPALARALNLAAEAGRWGLVERLARELSARHGRRGAGNSQTGEPPTLTKCGGQKKQLC